MVKTAIVCYVYFNTIFKKSMDWKRERGEERQWSSWCRQFSILKGLAAGDLGPFLLEDLPFLPISIRSVLRPPWLWWLHFSCFPHPGAKSFRQLQQYCAVCLGPGWLFVSWLCNLDSGWGHRCSGDGAGKVPGGPARGSSQPRAATSPGQDDGFVLTPGGVGGGGHRCRGQHPLPPDLAPTNWQRKGTRTRAQESKRKIFQRRLCKHPTPLPQQRKPMLIHLNTHTHTHTHTHYQCALLQRGLPETELEKCQPVNWRRGSCQWTPRCPGRSNTSYHRGKMRGDAKHTGKMRGLDLSYGWSPRGAKATGG